MVPVAVPPTVAERFAESGAVPDAGVAVKVETVRVAPTGVNGEPVGTTPVAE